MCREATKEVREKLFDYLLTVRPKTVSKRVTDKRIAAVREQLLETPEVWRDAYCKWANNPLWDDPVLFITTESDDRRRAVEYFWLWVEGVIVNNLKERNPATTWRDLQNNFAAGWDVDISNEDAQTLWEEFKPIFRRERQAFYNTNRAILRDCDRYGITPQDTCAGDSIDEPFDTMSAIRAFIREKIGTAAGFDDDEKFVPSDYVKKFGKEFRFENLAPTGND
jgi:hypothetical protein